VLVFSVDGRLVRGLYNGSVDPGLHILTWDGCDDRGRRVASGVYFVRVRTGEHVATRKMLLVR
jgi:hypothetical protein